MEAIRTLANQSRMDDQQEENETTYSLVIGYGVIQKLPNSKGWVGMHYFCDKLLRIK